MDPVTLKVLEWGATGVLAVALVALFRHKEKREAEHRAELAQLHKDHAAELAKMRDTFQVKADRQMDASFAALDRVGSALEAATSARRRRVGP